LNIMLLSFVFVTVAAGLTQGFALDFDDIEAAIANNTQLFNPSELIPLKRNLNITVKIDDKEADIASNTQIDDIEAAIANNTQLFNPDELIPLKRSLNITVQIDDIDAAIANNTELFNPDDLVALKRSLNVAAERATTKCGCGYSVSNLGRIVNGQEVNPKHSRPYQVYLQACSNRGCAMCGATLVNKRYALTAMHCVDGQINLNVVLGDHNIKQSIDNNSVKKIKVDEVIKRVDYDTTSTNNDIAILKLSEDVVFNDNIVPACLPSDSSKTYANTPAVVSGWGTTSEGGSTSDVLKETTITILSDTDPKCTIGAGENPLKPGKMCGYKQGTDSCQGDSGGPLVVKEDGRFTVVGVVSYGIGCARTGYAGVYARVTNYLNWINANIEDGWCSTTTPPPPPPTAAPTAAPTTTKTTTTTTTTTTSTTTTITSNTNSNPGPVCDLSCTNIGTLTGNYFLNNIQSRCDQGKCYAKDGQDLCKLFNSPCATPQGISCSKPCLLENLLGSYSSQQNIININIGYFTAIPSTCDLSTGYCCADDGSDLCARLGFLVNFYG